MNKRHYKILTVFITGIIFFSCDSTVEESTNLDKMLSEALVNASGGTGIEYYRLPEASNLAAIPQDPKNPLTDEKVALGQLLFHETAMGTEPDFDKGLTTFSCASCHHANAGFASGLKQGMGEGGVGFGMAGEGRRKDPAYPFKAVDVQPIKTPSSLNVAYQENMLFNGQFGATGKNESTEYAWLVNTPRELNYLGFEGTEIQAIASMNVHRMEMTPAFVEQFPEYKALFDKAFPDIIEEKRYNDTTAGLAMAAYQRTLLPTQSPFQQWLKGNTGALDQQSKEGALLFFGKAGCYTCHNGPGLNSMEFYALGMKDLYEAGNEILNSSRFSLENKGRGGFTEKGEDMFKFKVPQLYNLKDIRFFGHGASFSSVKEVVIYKNLANPQNTNVTAGQLSGEFKPLELTPLEVNKIISFLEEGLYDPDLQRYVPKSLPSGNCFPNNDPKSVADLNCK